MFWLRYWTSPITRSRTVTMPTMTSQSLIFSMAGVPLWRPDELAQMGRDELALKNYEETLEQVRTLQRDPATYEPLRGLMEAVNKLQAESPELYKKLMEQFK